MKAARPERASTSQELASIQGSRRYRSDDCRIAVEMLRCEESFLYADRSGRTHGYSEPAGLGSLVSVTHLESNNEAGDCFDLADQLAVNSNGAEVRIRTSLAKQIRT